MKQNKSSRSTVLLFLLGAALIVAALIMLVPDLLNYKQSNDTYEALKENYISEKAENTEVADETEGDLTSAEYRLLCLLVRNANRVVTRDIILNELWDDTGNFVDDNTLSVYVRRLREKVETNPSHPEHLITIRGFGYQWKEVSI